MSHMCAWISGVMAMISVTSIGEGRIVSAVMAAVASIILMALASTDRQSLMEGRTESGVRK